MAETRPPVPWCDHCGFTLVWDYPGEQWTDEEGLSECLSAHDSEHEPSAEWFGAVGSAALCDSYKAIGRHSTAQLPTLPRPAENAEATGVIHTETPCENEHERPVDE